VSAAENFVERLVDRMNPIVVKEVRASLRSRVFRILFPLVVAAAVAIAIATIMNNSGSSTVGREVFGPVYGWLCVTVLAIVPLTAFLSMGSEWDENTYDLLVISDLRPRQIVLGKLLSASIGTVLYFSAFAPVLVFAFLLRGIDIREVLALLAGTFLASLAASALALAASSLSRLRVVRVLLLAAVVGIGILGVTIATYFAQRMVMRRFGVSAGADEAWTAILVTLGLLCLGITVACERIAHQDENHSTGPRILVTLALLGFMGWFLWVVGAIGRASSDDLWIGAAVMTLLAALADVFFVTEHEVLSRRVRRTVPKRRWLALLAFPLLPGGARGLVLFLAQVMLIFVFTSVLESMHTLSASMARSFDPDAVLGAVGFVAYMFVYLGVGSFAFRHRTHQAFMRWMARVAVVGLALLTIFAPAFVGFLAGDVGAMNLRHPLNPFWGTGIVYTTARRGPWILAACVVALIVFALNVPRILRALKETLEASDENRVAALRATIAARKPRIEREPAASSST
jgi:hypothetical protein